MAKTKARDQSLLAAMTSANLYKRTQGKLTRQLTAVGVAAVVLLGAYTLAGSLMFAPDGVRYGVPLAISVVGCWIAFRIVNTPYVADFLISVQAEMDKVSWASREELKRSTIVVISTMFFLAAALRLYDFFWVTIFTWLGILHPGDAGS